MKIAAVNGSPRGIKSNTKVMLDAILDSYIKKGHRIHTINLSEYEIKYCKGCYACWTTSPGKCVHDDDVRELLEIMRDADLLILGSPLYFNNISGTMKVFIDRLTALGGSPHNKGEEKNAKGKLIIVSNCGFPIRQQFDVIALWVRHLSNLLKLDLIGEFYTTSGKVLTSMEPNDGIKREKYVEYLKKCGECLERDGKLEDTLTADLGKDVSRY